ncbi:PAS/PAC sensor hybrid histidine kinase [Nitrosospira sp. Nsp2]|uniref:PAS domain-containing hybrid sensor histidine kinase/response regulator n=1 Tax=Nitrosospira sp. Nsp2 TaxID=136548 RepID=UPI000D420212|nr:hybrid sensor histidine kinase/response regulator [Nitrosospira sp. Nsp2]PTR16203.1 PAS/PAC sensor hybrid histidine kinase [Nitrosospira sp. Nsp2]
MAMIEDNEEKLLRCVALQTSTVILQARQRAEHELRQAKKELEEKAKQLDHSLSILRATIETTTDGILVTDEHGIVLRFNERYLQLWQIPREATGFREHWHLLTFCCKQMKDPQGFLGRAAEIYTSWPPDTYDVLELIDGTVLERFSKMQFIEEQNVGRVWSFRDITARRRAEEAVRESVDRLRFMADAMPLKISTTRADGEVDYVNQQWVDYAGLGAEQMMGWEWTKLIHPEDVDENIKRWRRALDTGEPFQMEHRFRKADGKYRWHLTRAQAKRDMHGNVSMWVGSHTDIDSIKRGEEEKKQLLENERLARAEAERASRVKDEFLATLSHELRTPLNAILGWSQLILQGTMNPDNIQRGLETIERNARAQNKLIADLLEMSSIISGKVRLDMQRLDLAVVVEAAVESIAPAAQAKGINLRTSIGSPVGPVSGDNNRLQQIIWNLLSNAVKFTPCNGNVDIVMERVDSYLQLTVKDTGPGIQPEFLPYVFDRFRQADSSLTRQHGGLGLGLSIVKQLVGLHGGTVRAESAGQGKGAAFIVCLPLAPVMEAKAPLRQARLRSSNPQSEQITLPGVRILVIDDEEDSRGLIHEVLTRHEAEVVCAASAEEGLKILERQKPDLIISDIGMPEKDGYQLIREIRNLGATRGGNIPAIALTAFARPEDRIKAMIAGFQTHLPKPVEAHELIATIRTLTRWVHRPDK